MDPTSASPGATLAANSRAIVSYEPFVSELHGVFLISLRHFAIPLPDKIDSGATGVQSSIALSSTRLYVSTEKDNSGAQQPRSPRLVSDADHRAPEGCT
jgi:hypothetical protein